MNFLNRTCDGASVSTYSRDYKSVRRLPAPTGRRWAPRSERSDHPRAEIGGSDPSLVQDSASLAPTVVLERSKTAETPGARVILLPTAHVSAQSSKDAREIIRSIRPDIVLLEVCDERINGVMERIRGRGEDFLVPSSVHIDGLPTGTLPGGVEATRLLSTLRTQQGMRVSATDLFEDAKRLINLGLFDSVRVSAAGKESKSLIWDCGSATTETNVSEVVFDVCPAVGELTSDIRFSSKISDCVKVGSTEDEVERRIMRRAGELVASSDCAGGEGEMNAWQFGALCSALLIAVSDEIKNGYTATLDLNEEGVISLVVNNDALAQADDASDRIAVDIDTVLSVSLAGRSAALEAIKASSLTVKILNMMFKTAELTVSGKVDAKDGEDIVAGLSAAFEAQTSRICLADREMSETMRSLDKQLQRKVAGTKRSMFRYIFASIRSMITSSLKSQEELSDAIEKERLELMRSGDVDMPPYMREVLIDERDEALFECLWSVSQGMAVDRPCFCHESTNRFEYLPNVPAVTIRREEDDVPITVVAVFGAAHLPGIIRRWEDRLSRCA